MIRTSQLLASAAASALLILLSSCGDHHQSKSSTKSYKPDCSELNCLSSVAWKIVLEGKNFPEKSRVDVNGTTVLNECVSKQKYAIDRGAIPQELVMDNFYVPSRGNLKIDITDLGNDCNSESSFISESDVEFEVLKDMDQSQILIRL